jgi:ketopantoate reductase
VLPIRSVCSSASPSDDDTTGENCQRFIIGAGSMGIITGYHLDLAGAEVTFLIRPHRKEALDRPQILYCYDGNQLKEYTGYTYITDPAKMVGASYDYIVVTLDGIALRNPSAKAW